MWTDVTNSSANTTHRHTHTNTVSQPHMRKHVMNLERVPATEVSVSAEVFAALSDIFNLWPSHPHRPLKSRTAARAFCVCSKSERLRNAALAAAHVRDGLRQYLSKGRRNGQHVALGRCERFLSLSHATETHRLQLRQTDTYKMPLRKIFIVVVIHQAFAQSFHSSFHVLPVS